MKLAETSQGAPDGPVLYTSTELALLLKVSRRQVHRMAESGEIASVRVGKRLRFPAAGLIHLLKGTPCDPLTIVRGWLDSTNHDPIATRVREALADAGYDPPKVARGVR